MGLRLILSAVLLLTLLHMCCGTKDYPNQARHEDLWSLAISRREVAAHAHNDLHVVVRRDTTDTGQPAGAGFPLSDGLPPPGEQLPPLITPNEDPATAAPSVVITPSPTAGNGSPSSRSRPTFAYLVLCLVSCLFLRQTL
ncbi:uncharacterized protein LOC119739042 [Patiria miniata]|uniref:Uncharacterized protein n=1 Tax=Patiria miniata TaxID=46514 RepID=A0A914B1Y5_PATMI|nr:uncharacterized protein LOC119739042 [Patiria miniata]